jgi:ribonuclease Z
MKSKPKLEIMMYGTRGSMPVAGPDFEEFGGNTTCLRIFSEAIPKDSALIIDAGSGFTKCSVDLMAKGIFKINLLFTHWHYDHTMGIMSAPHTFDDNSDFKISGPEELKINTFGIFRRFISPPIFPVSFNKLRHRFRTKSFNEIGTEIILIHPEGGTNCIPIYIFMNLIKQGRQMPFLENKFYDLKECMVIKMFKTEHPNRTISYRIEDHPSGKVFVFLTDHENTDTLSADIIKHAQGADLLIQDCQFDREQYKKTAGHGHGTPDRCVELMRASNVKRLGLTHHSNHSNDEKIKEILNEAIRIAREFDPEGYPEKSAEDDNYNKHPEILEMFNKAQDVILNSNPENFPEKRLSYGEISRVYSEVKKALREAMDIAKFNHYNGKIFACYDFMEITV